MFDICKLKKQELLDHVESHYGFVMYRKSITKKKMLEIIEFIEKGDISCG